MVLVMFVANDVERDALVALGNAEQRRHFSAALLGQIRGRNDVYRVDMQPGKGPNWADASRNDGPRGGYASIQTAQRLRLVPIQNGGDVSLLKPHHASSARGASSCR